MPSKLAESIVRDVLLAIGARSNDADRALAAHNVDADLRPVRECLVDCDSDLSAYAHGRPLTKDTALRLSYKCRDLSKKMEST